MQSGSAGFTVSSQAKRWFFKHYTVHITRKGFRVSKRGRYEDLVMETRKYNNVMKLCRDKHVEHCRGGYSA